MNNLYDIVEMCVIFFLLVIIIYHIKNNLNLVETFTRRDLDDCRNTGASIAGDLKKTNTLRNQIKNANSEILKTTRKLKSDSKRINDLMKAAKNKADKTGANPNAVKD